MRVKAIIFLIIAFLPGLLGAQNDSILIKRWILSDCIDYALEQNIQVRQSILSNLANKVNREQAQAQFQKEILLAVVVPKSFCGLT